MLEQCDERFVQTGLTSLHASGIGLLTILIRDKLVDIKQNLSHLSDDCEIEFKYTMEHICQIEERKDQMREARQVADAQQDTIQSGMITNLMKAAGGWRLMATSYMKIIN